MRPGSGSVASADLCRATSARTAESRTFAELLIDCEEDRVLRAVLVGMLREGDQGVARRSRVTRARRARSLEAPSSDKDSWSVSSMRT
jgi:hypothetical protein